MTPGLKHTHLVRRDREGGALRAKQLSIASVPAGLIEEECEWSDRSHQTLITLHRFNLTHTVGQLSVAVLLTLFLSARFPRGDVLYYCTHIERYSEDKAK